MGFPNTPREWNALLLRTRDYFLVAAGELATIHVGKRRLVEARELEKFVERLAAK